MNTPPTRPASSPGATIRSAHVTTAGGIGTAPPTQLATLLHATLPLLLGGGGRRRRGVSAFGGGVRLGCQGAQRMKAGRCPQAARVVAVVLEGGGERCRAVGGRMAKYSRLL